MNPTKYPKSICKLFLWLLIIVIPYVSFAQPSNDNCSNATSRTSSTSCNNNQYNLRNATASSFTISGTPCVTTGSGVHYDVWFQFSALNSTHTATISSLEAGFTSPEVAIFSGTCAGTLTQVACGTTTATATGLTVGTTYYVRVSNVGAAITGNNGDFDFCITHLPVAAANDNCSGATVLTSSSACNSVTGNLRYATSSGIAGACTAANPTYDVWFSFQANSTTQAVTVSGLGGNLSSASTYMQVFSGTCGSLTSLACQTVATTNGRITLTTLTPGTIYYVRVYVISNPTASSTNDWNFNICVQQPPPNDECAGAISLTSGATCSNTRGTLDLTIASSAAFGCTAGTYYDVWYSFTATATSHTITLSGLGANFTSANARIQVFSGTCGTLVPLASGCVTGTTHTQTLLTPTVTYYVRIASLTTIPSGPGSVAQFDICITAAAAPPANDECSGAITLVSGTTCSNTSGTLIRATASSPVVPGSCGNASAPDVWFQFVAQSTYPIINLSSIGTNLQTNGRVQLLTGSCAGLVAVGSCHSIPASTSTSLNTVTNPGGIGLVIGQTYYIRVTHNTLAAPVTTGTYTFNICVTDPTPVARTVIDYAKSYVNLSDSIGGGTINPGDILEIRATLVIRNTAGAKTIDSVAFYDTLAPGAGLSLIDNSIATRTNEGKLFQSFTASSADADAGWYTTAGAGTDTAIQINLGTSATRTNKTSLSNTSRPSLFTSTCVIMATYRVTVTGAYGTKINYGGGSFTYRDRTGTGFGVRIDFPKDSLMVFQGQAICPDNLVQTNILGDEFNGTFGAATTSASGSQNRGISPNTNYTYQPFNTVGPSFGPGDYFYAVANNTSTNHSIVQTLQKPSATPPRLFGHWDVSGDHTGAADQAKGNKPCNPALPVSADNPCGYMLVVNAAYRTDVAFTFGVSGACPNTYYEISSWVKNICYRCGNDVNGVGTAGGTYIPTGPGDSSGVRPNLAYEINGVDYYTTGNINYRGLGGTNSGSDTLNEWVQRSFVYRTGENETDFVLTIRNNAPGGGGNDWALDDITLKTCLPNFQMNPSNSPTYCNNNQVDMSVQVSSFFDTYQYYQWERSTDGGVNWSPAPELPGTQSFTYSHNGVSFVDTVYYPSILATAAINGYQYRIKTASTLSNLSSGSCSVANSTDIIAITVQSSCAVLPAELLKFNVELNGNKSALTWKTKGENLSGYEVERSNDGVNFSFIGFVNAKGINGNETSYFFNDPVAVSGKVYYRLKMVGFATENNKYSNTLSVTVNLQQKFEITNLVNPFISSVSFQLTAFRNEQVELQLTDALGHPIVNRKIAVNKGANSISFEVPQHIAKGSYLLRVVSASGSIHKIIQKQ